MFRKGLKQTRRAAIDVGTNSVLLVVADVAEDGRLNTVAWHYVVSRLGEGLYTKGRLQEKPIQRTLNAINEALQVARENGATEVLVSATEVMRSAANRDEFIDRVKKECGCGLHVFSEKQEALYSFRGSLQDIPGDAFVVIDVGGGSTEVACGDANGLFHHLSRQMGVVFLAEQMGSPDKLNEEQRRGVQQRVLAAFADASELKGFEPGSTWIGAGGTLSLLALLDQGLEKYDPEKVHGYAFSAQRLWEWYDKLNSISPAMRLKLGVEKGREDVLLFGILIYTTLMEQGNCKQILATDRGLRYGVLFEKKLFEKLQ